MKDLHFNPKWLALLGLAGLSFIAFDSVAPGAGVALAAGVALWWFIDTDAAAYLSRGVKQLREAAAL